MLIAISLMILVVIVLNITDIYTNFLKDSELNTINSIVEIVLLLVLFAIHYDIIPA
jgi:hypothetical protein